MVRVKRNGIEGTVSPLVTDATKIVCSYCGGTSFMLSSTMDDPNDVAGDTDFAALLITFASGTSCQGLVALCSECGHEQVPLWYMIDVGANTGAATTMTNLVQATTANLLAGLYLIPCVGTDIGKYFTITSNTAADPTVITTSVAPNDDSDGVYIITNILPLGFTAGS